MKKEDPVVDRFLERGMLSPEDLGEAALQPEEERQLGSRRGRSAGKGTRMPGQIGRYRVFEEVGSGGAARVYLCEDLRLHRPVALKVLQSTDPLHVARFQREAEVAAGLDHPNIVKVFESGERQGHAYIAMQFIKGRPIEGAVLGQKGSLEAVRKIALALDYAHARQILHRDVKPANILLDESGEVFLTDFGLGRETHGGTLSVTGAVLGTPAYMSPEQARGSSKEVGPRSDVYSLGATLYELMTGHPPVEGVTAFDILQKVSRGEIVPARQRNPKLSRQIDVMIQKAMALEPSRRYGSALEFAEDLGRFLAGRPIHANPPSVTYRIRKAVRRHVVALALLVGVAAGGMAALWKTRDEGAGAAPRIVQVEAVVPRMEHWVYRDGLTKGWYDWSWSSNVFFDHAAPVYSGSRSIRTQILKPWGALHLGVDDGISLLTNAAEVEFYVHGGETGRGIYLQLYETQNADSEMTPLQNVGSVEVGKWQKFRVRLSDLNPQGKPVRSLAIASDVVGDMYVDEIRLFHPPAIPGTASSSQD